jgi:hypothetical protein
VQGGDDLFICGHDGILNHYRVRDGTLRFRWVADDNLGPWRTLSDNDILMHLMLKTRVAEWLYARRGMTSISRKAA